MRRIRIFYSSTSNQWISSLITTGRGIASFANCAPIPWVGAALSAGVALLELIQTIGKTTDDLRYLAESVVSLMKRLRDEFDAHPSDASPRLQQVCTEINTRLVDISNDISEMSKDWSSSKFKKYLKANCVRDEIAQFNRLVSDLRADATLATALGTRLDIARVGDVVSAVNCNITQIQEGLAMIGPPSAEISKREYTSFEENFHSLRIGDMHLNLETACAVAYQVHAGEDNPNGGLCERSWTDYKGSVKGSPYTIRVYRGAQSSQIFRQFLTFLADHSPIASFPQLFGYCESPRFPALVFHEEFRTLDEYAASLSSSREIVRWETCLHFDFKSLDASLKSKHGRIQLHRQLAQVDARTGKLLIAQIDSESSFVEHPAYHDRFCRWFYKAHRVDVMLRSKNPTQLEIENVKPEGHNALYSSLLELVKLLRGDWIDIWVLPRDAGLASTGTVFDATTHRVIATLDPYDKVAMNVLRSSFEWVVNDWQSDKEWAHFVIPLNTKENKRASFVNHREHCGYFLTATFKSEVDIPAAMAWILQAPSIMGDEFDPSRCIILLQSILRLRWEMILVDETEDSLALLENLPELHVFVERPTFSHKKPRVYWSTDALDVITSELPPRIFANRINWSTGTECAMWEKHHYDVARIIQEEHGFDSSTSSAAHALGLPLFVRSNSGVVSEREQLLG
ncbi:hypothetical protein R3P38DRAFT_3023061 [Favolaschia claudopus]|uniref:Fungal N-terminal domain-containing protein n=1 Tax=Favolaschia claudopus TaxID=2862362 RepID=A0AAW0AHA4_9AGAR